MILAQHKADTAVIDTLPVSVENRLPIIDNSSRFRIKKIRLWGYSVAHTKARYGCALSHSFSFGFFKRAITLHGRPWWPTASTLLTLAILASAMLNAQTPSQQSSVLRNHHPLWANPQNDAGAVPPSQRFDGLTLVLARSPEQESAFEALLADQQNPSSPEYHHWLTPAEVGARFGLSDSDIASITGWLQSEGLHVSWIAPSHIFIGFGGAAADLDRAFQTELHYYNVNGVRRMAISSDPLIPQALAPTILAVRGLYTLEDRPALYTNKVQSASPQLTANDGSHFIAPADFALIYDLPNLNDISGSNQTIAIVGRSRTNFADFSNFRSLTQSTFPNPTEIVPTAYGGVDPGPAYTTPPASGTSLADQSEATLDVLRAGSVAPGANLLLVVASKASGGIETDAQYIVNTTPVPAQVMTISFGACESSAGASGVNYWNNLFEQAAAEGISSFVSSGDSGASGCDADFTTPPVSPQPNSINYICSSGYATCVGGTEFNDVGGNYWSSDNNTNLESVTGYIPEGGWNEPLNSSSAPQVAASGGGVSAYIPTPSWQTGVGVPTARAGRYTPDVSFSASCHDAYFACFAAGGASCVRGSNGSFEFVSFCGTSAAAPAMAGLTALLDQQKGTAEGNINQGLYLAAASQSSIFHDATVASSGVTSCSVNTPSMCNNSAPGTTGLTGGQEGYLVGTGYDEVTGLGSPDGVYFLSSYAAKITPTVTVTPTPSTVTVVQPFTVAVTVSTTGSYPTPTGSVTLTSGTYTSAALTLSNGAASFSIPAGSVSGGPLTVKYTPDSTSATLYNSATGSAWVIVNLLPSIVTITPASSSVTTAQTLGVTVAVSGGSGNATPTGTVDLSSDNYSGSATLSGGSASFSIGPGLLAAGTATLSAYYSPDAQSSSIYSSNTAYSPVTVTGTASLTPTITVTPSATATVVANPLQVSVTVNGGSGHPTPTGSITLVTGAYSATAALAGGAAAFTIPAQTLNTGNITLTAIYTPDTTSTATYNNASGAATIEVFNPQKAAPTVTLFPSANSILSTQALSVDVTVGSSIGLPIPATGSVVLSGGGYNSTATPISGSQITFNIPAGALALGADTLTASYTPDTQSSTVYLAGSGTTTVTVAAPAPPSFNISNGSVSLYPGIFTNNTVAVTVTPAGGFTGNVTLTATITASPHDAQDLPTLSFGSTSPVSITGTGSGTATLTILTTAPVNALLAPSGRRFPRSLQAAGAGGSALACLLLFGIPGCRRRRNLFLLLALFAIFAGGVAACGGGGGSGGGGTSSPGTTTGNYTITVTGTSGSTTSTGTVSLGVL